MLVSNHESPTCVPIPAAVVRSSELVPHLGETEPSTAEAGDPGPASLPLVEPALVLDGSERARLCVDTDGPSHSNAGAGPGASSCALGIAAAVVVVVVVAAAATSVPGDSVDVRGALKGLRRLCADKLSSLCTFDVIKPPGSSSLSYASA